jgi:cob(I)alamin adenosyltransferase
MTGIGRGYTHVYTGSGKGKTTAALGLALRAAGHGLRVLMVQFLKGSDPTGEKRALEEFLPAIRILARGRGGVLDPSDLLPEDRILATEALEEARREIISGAWDVVVLDEVNSACYLGLLDVPDILGIMDARPGGVELILTGRGAPEEVLEKADLVTEMKEIKHYFHRGVTAREGIER